MGTPSSRQALEGSLYNTPPLGEAEGSSPD